MNEEQKSWFENIYRALCLAGRFTPAVWGAFRTVLEASAGKDLEVTILEFHRNTKHLVSAELQLPESQFAFLDFDRENPVPPHDLFDGFRVVWLALCALKDARGMMSLRLCMHSHCSPEEQSEYIGKWNAAAVEDDQAG
jgi:hypothetical protein